MKVLYIINIPSPYRVEFFNELSKFCELTVIYESDRATDRNDAWKGEASGGYKKIFLKGIRTGAEARFCPAVLKYIKKSDFDVVVVYGYSSPTGMLAIMALHRKGIKFFLNADGGFIKDDESKTKKKIKHFFISKATWWLSSGELTSKYLEHYGAIPDKIFEYPFSSVRQADILQEALSKEQKAVLREHLGVQCDRLVLSVGQFIQRKGYLGFLTDWTKKARVGMGLVLIGGGDEQELYKQLAEECENVWILPFLKKHELMEYYKAADAFVLPTNEDIWGLVINEALSFRIPIFSTTNCVAAMTIKSPDISVFPTGDNEAIISAIKAMPSERPECNLVFDYTIESMAKRHIEIFELCRKQRRFG